MHSMKVSLVAAMSVNGKIAEHGDQSSLDWTSKEDLRFFVEKTKEAGVVIMGRKTFATIGKPLKDRKLVVLTSRPNEQESMIDVEYTADEPAMILGRLEREGYTQVVIAGGASVYSQFLSAGLVTDLFLTIEPVLFGGGVLLAEGFDRVSLKFVEMKMLNEQTIVIHYQTL